MVTRKGTSSITEQKHRRIVKEIEKKFGKVIDLERSPFVLVEIIRQFGHQFEEGGGGEGGVSPTSIAVAGPPDPPEPPEPPDPPDGMPEGVVTRLLLTMQKDIKSLSRKLDSIATKTK
jgi:hypothetical protein